MAPLPTMHKELQPGVRQESEFVTCFQATLVQIGFIHRQQSANVGLDLCKSLGDSVKMALPVVTVHTNTIHTNIRALQTVSTHTRSGADTS